MTASEDEDSDFEDLEDRHNIIPEDSSMSVVF